jgi:hypothetical protein
LFINDNLLDGMEGLSESMDEVEDASAPDMASMGQYLADEAGRIRDRLDARLAAQEDGAAPPPVVTLIDAADRASQAGTEAHDACAGDVSGSRAAEECQSAFAKAVKAKSDLYHAFDWAIESM